MSLWYEVMGNQIQVAYRRQGPFLIFDILVSRIEPVSTSGDTIIGQDTIPEVKTYPILVRQKGILTRNSL